ncbi:hypothetical protein OPT61_g96 [Boeremia exigua]|uniref:Uncharacterized protein n=1 Tax=Boeremia exigua TaxID=749465 RepID=A0ACC2IV10_9PLEO|nr:hypothetical protein OPT61_g96 [Boeremia exigua]
MRRYRTVTSPCLLHGTTSNPHPQSNPHPSSLRLVPPHPDHSLARPGTSDYAGARPQCAWGTVRTEAVGRSQTKQLFKGAKVSPAPEKVASKRLDSKRGGAEGMELLGRSIAALAPVSKIYVQHHVAEVSYLQATVRAVWESHVSARNSWFCSPLHQALRRHLARYADVRHCAVSELGGGRGAIGGRVNKPGGWSQELLCMRGRIHWGALTRLWRANLSQALCGLPVRLVETILLTEHRHSVETAWEDGIIAWGSAKIPEA